MPAVAIFDIDGTLVDTNYQHALAWYRAFRSKGVVIPIWRIHRAIGIGSDRVVALLAGEQIEGRLGEALRVAQGAEYQELVDDVEPMEGAHELLEELKQAGHTIILASSAEEKDVERYIGLLDAKELVDAYTTSAAVVATKPEPDILNAAIQKAGGGTAVMIGDSTWDLTCNSSSHFYVLTARAVFVAPVRTARYWLAQSRAEQNSLPYNKAGPSAA